MVGQKLRHEERWGPVGASLYRVVIPLGLLGAIILTLPLIWATSVFMFGLYPLLVAGIGYSSWRNVMLSRGAGRLIATALGIALTGGAALLAVGLFVGSGGI
jgi:hypothetical protein